MLVLGDRVTLEGVTAKSISISSASGVTISRSNIGGGDADGVHITSDRGRMVGDVVLDYNLVHDPQVSAGAHYDGTQVRGINGLQISCSVYDAGAYRPQYNAGIYLEDANGGTQNVTIANNWILGWGHSLMVDARNVQLVGNHFGGDIKWGVCYVGKRVGASSFTLSDNVMEPGGRPVSPCVTGTKS
ncbi:right-handed parallel beta-helix repeat-containing protein [Intrasporangium chromatireducens]|uniref:right-handed parallel beta-helix repeat-containing protein n=1 Tax=Intrasporangium chromatireducens TaxID=1386088 RepID=UPI001F0A0829